MSDVPAKLVQRLRSCTSFPTPPAVAMQVVALAQDPEIDLGRVADVVSADPAIAAKVMRIANSALYARRRQSTNLRQALIVLGLNATLTLALSFTIVTTLRRDPPKGFDFGAYWRRAILAATWGKLLATELSRRDAEEVFLAALLQDIGMLALDKVAPEVYQGISPFQLDHARVAQHEQSCIGTDHRAVGAWLLGSWNLPKALTGAVQHSHDVSARGVDAELREFVKCVALAGELADLWLTARPEEGIARAGALARDHLNIPGERLADLFAVIQEQLPVAQELFDMEIVAGAQMQDVVDQAREILMLRNIRLMNEVTDLRSHASKLHEENSVLKEESSRDALTGSCNRRAFEEALEREFATAGKHQWPLSVVFVDLDHFKSINDGHGHPAGDLMLKEVASLLRASLRDTDIVARYGGDEFVLLLPGVDGTLANRICERIIEGARRRKVESAPGQAVSITLSVGVATCDSASAFHSPQDLLAAADAALYHSKRNGRDRHTCYDTIKAA